MEKEHEQSTEQLFSLGAVVVTRGAFRAFKRAREPITPYLDRHAAGDWSEMNLREQQTNQWALEEDAPIKSTYHTPAGKLWIVTEADRSATTILMPEE